MKTTTRTKATNAATKKKKTRRMSGFMIDCYMVLFLFLFVCLLFLFLFFSLHICKIT